MRKRWVFLVAFSWLVSCSPSPQPISFGQDSCDYCRMTIVDPKFSSELVTRKGKVYKFDSIECLAGFAMEKMPDRKKVHSLWVANFNQPDQFLSAATAVFLRSDKLRSPMSMNLSAFATQQAAEVARKEYSGQLMSWEEVMQLIREKWLAQKQPHKLPSPVQEHAN